MGDINAFEEKNVQVRWIDPKLNALWFFFSKFVIYQIAL